MVKAGSSRTTWPCVTLTRSRRLKHSLTMSPASNVRSSPIMAPQNANVSDHVGNLAAKCLELFAGTARRWQPRALEQALGFDGLDGRQRGAAGDRIAAEGRGVHAGLEHFGDLLPGDHDPGGKSPGQGLGAGQDVGLDPVVLVGEPFPGAPHSGLHFIQDQQNAALVAQLPQPVAGSQALGY